LLTKGSNGGQSCRKGRQVITKLGSLSIVCVQLGPQKLSVIRSSRVSTIQGSLSIEVNGRTVGISELSITLYRGYPLLSFLLRIQLCLCACITALFINRYIPPTIVFV